MTRTKHWIAGSGLKKRICEIRDKSKPNQYIQGKNAREIINK